MKWTIYSGLDLFKRFLREANQYLSALGTRLPQWWKKCLSSFQKSHKIFPRKLSFVQPAKLFKHTLEPSFFDS